MFLLIIGVILVLVGAVVYRELGPEPLVRLAAALLVIGGIVCAVIGIVEIADVHTNDATLVAEDVQVGSYSFAVPGVTVVEATDSYGKGAEEDSYGDSYGKG